MAKIEKLTPEQIAKFPAYVAEWKGYGLSTEPADKLRAEAAIILMYSSAGLKEPRIIWTKSPLANALALGILKSDVGASVGDSVRASVGASVWDSVGDSVWASVRASVWASVRASVRASVGASVGDSVGDSVYGQHDASWLAFYMFFHRECGLKDQTEKLRGLWELCQSAGWALPYEGVCFVSERHAECHLDDNGRIHCETGPAIRYDDGFAIHAWHGTRVPAEWIDNKNMIDPAIILKADNVEQRAVGAEIIGWPRMLSALKSKTIDKHESEDVGELIELTLPGLSQPGRFLKARCPRNGLIAEGIPYVSDIDGSPINTALAAQAWRIGDPQSEYVHPEVRT